MTRWWIALALTASFFTAHPAAAQTIGYADAIDGLAVACGADIQKYCKGINLGNNRLRNCLNQNAEKVSSQCKIGYVRAMDLLQKRINAQRSVTKVCAIDAARLCKGIQPGDGNLLECILLAQKQVSATCNQAVTDAGYR